MLALNCSILNREYTVINALKALYSIISMYDLYVILISKITPRYITHKYNITSIQCKKGLRRSTSKREVDPLSRFFLDFDIPTLTSHHITSH
jgi:hypothetical protein